MDIKDTHSFGYAREFTACVFVAVLCGLALLWGLQDWPAPAELRIGLGMVLFFIAPGFFLGLIILGRRRICAWEWLPLSIALSMGVWAVPGLAAYVLELPLAKVTVIELSMLALLFIAALLFEARNARPAGEIKDERPAFPTLLVVCIVGVLAVGLSAWLGAFRGAELDWDYFNYISHIRKLLSWDQASIALFAYKDAPPDPVHSYNIWALQWSLIGRLFELDPIELYSRSAFVTIPASLLAFFGLARRLLSESAARTGLILYFFYHLIYGGFVFLGRTTFYPADSQWLLVFPACLFLFTFFFDEVSKKERAGVFAGVALSALAMSVVHVLWGLCFFIVLGLFFVIRFAVQRSAGERMRLAWRSRKKAAICVFVLLVLAPYVLAVSKVVAMAVRNSPDGKLPLFTGRLEALFSLPAWAYALALVVLPAGAMLYLLWKEKPVTAPAGPGGFMPASRVLWIIAGCLVVAVPYILLRYEAIQATNWGQFGRNPYRAFISETLFMLNPFQRTLQNPNMTFFPLYIPAYLALPLLWKKRSEFKGSALILAVLMSVPLICFNPVVAPLFTELFSLGYLRRLLRLAALFSFLPLGLLVCEGAGFVFAQERRPYLHTLLAVSVVVLISAAGILFPARPEAYNEMLKKRTEVALKWSKDSLIFDATPFRAIRSHEWFEKDAVVFADIWTSYRLTAYLPQYVAVQVKPGTGVSDQDSRRLLTREFFDRRTSITRMREILDRFGAEGVIINRNPFYRMPAYNRLCGHPEAAGKLLRDDDHFELLWEKDDWLIFRYRP